MTSDTAKPGRAPNRLAREKSPYLLQHQYNPVDWQAWNAEAFAAARAQDKPVFLSIGYSTCHWCHVMERESFEDQRVADFLNAHFVSIKVDREERPDVDKIYMTFVQSTSGGGGWPLNCFLTPDLKPFYGGTYFPPETRHGRPSFLDLLTHIRQLWETRRADLAESSVQLHERLEEITAREPEGEGELDSAALDRAVAWLKGAFDPQNGGFGGAPKFPQPGYASLLLRRSAQTGDAEGLKMVLHTCERMAAGGIHDQIGGGFARYAVDGEWLVPHFEKMLYDNAQLACLYLDAWLASGQTRHAGTARDILDYVLRDLTHPGGGFFSAEDADSEGKEGKFYCWTRAELLALLTPGEFQLVVRRFGITEHGNFTDHSDPHPLPGQNVLSLVAEELSAGEAVLLDSAVAKMLVVRGRRVRPLRDDKVLASWNGLMLSAVARAAAALEDAVYLAAARKNLEFLRSNLWDQNTRTLFHRWREGERDAVQLQEAYAFLLGGVVDLYEATLDADTLAFAIALAEEMISRFFDAEAGGYWQSPPNSPDLILRVKEDYDGAEPSGNSVAAVVILKLAAITGRADFRTVAEKTLRLFSGRMKAFPQAAPVMLAALDSWLNEPARIVITGDPADAATRKLIHAAHAVYRPNKVVLGIAGDVDAFAKTLPAAKEPIAFFCTGTACQPPTSDPDGLKKMLQSSK